MLSVQWWVEQVRAELVILWPMCTFEEKNKNKITTRRETEDSLVNMNLQASLSRTII